MTSFNASNYLSKIDPSHSYETEQLTGGLVNITIRATKKFENAAATGLDQDQGRFPGHATLILKHALPYIAAIGPEAPFSRTRQRTEALTLELFELPQGSLSGLPLASSVLIPQLLQYDLNECVLVISDLGPLKTLASVLAELATDVDPQSTDSLRRNSHRVGSRLGQFLGDLHAPHRAIFDRNPSPSDVAAKRNVEFEWAVKPVERHLSRFDVPDAKELYERIVEDFQPTDSAGEQSFVLGDLTPGAILLGDLSSGEQTPLGVIDWEFSGQGRGMHGDMAQLLAQVHLHLIAAQEHNRQIASTAIEALTDGITTSYRMQRREADPAWGASLTPLVNRNSPIPPLKAAAAAAAAETRMLRSAFILHGREMINGAFDLDWHCDCSYRYAGSETVKETEREKEKYTLVQTMVERGVWYLRTSTASNVDFVREENWKNAVMEEKGRVLVNMLWGSSEDGDT